MSSETEVKFIILHPYPDTIAEQLAELHSLADYPLETGKDQHIFDRYLDTPGKFLKDHELALRLRLKNDQYMLTLKGKSEITGDGAVQRMEIENIWSEDTLKEIATVLNREGLSIDLSGSPFSKSSPMNTLQMLSLEPFHERSTERKIRWILDPEARQTIAELAIDTAIYRFENEQIIHYEIEIEESSKISADFIRACISALREKFSDYLQVWTINKLQLGLILENLVDKPEFRKMIDSKNQITAKGYHTIIRMSQKNF